MLVLVSRCYFNLRKRTLCNKQEAKGASRVCRVKSGVGSQPVRGVGLRPADWFRTVHATVVQSVGLRGRPGDHFLLRCF